MEGGMGVYGIAVLGFFSSVISVILIFMCGITVSLIPGGCGLSSFRLTVFGKSKREWARSFSLGKRRSFTVLRHGSFALSCHYSQSMMKLVKHPMSGHFDRGTYQFEVLSRFLALFNCWCIQAWDKQRSKMDTHVVSIFRRLPTRYFSIHQFFLRYYGIGYPQCPPPHVYRV